MPDQGSNLSENLRRLIYWHHRSAREAAQVLGVSERTLSGWMTGRTEPSYRSLMRLADVYQVNPAFLAADQVRFAQQLTDPTRWEEVDRILDMTDEERRRAKLRVVVEDSA